MTIENQKKMYEQVDALYLEARKTLNEMKALNDLTIEDNNYFHGYMDAILQAQRVMLRYLDELGD